MIRRRIIVTAFIIILAVSLGSCGSDRTVVSEKGGTQDLSGFSSKTDWTPMFPIYMNSIVWETVPKDFTGVLDSWVTPKYGNDGYVNIRENPSLSAKIIGELRRDDANLWWCRKEFYVDNGQIHMGIYKVKHEDYTWTPVQYGESRTNFQMRGWVALELVEVKKG